LTLLSRFDITVEVCGVIGQYRFSDPGVFLFSPAVSMIGRLVVAVS